MYDKTKEVDAVGAIFLVADLRKENLLKWSRVVG